MSQDMSKVQPIQANVTGFGGMPVSLFSAWDDASGILTLAVDADYRAERREGCLLITNVKGIERDAWFDSADLREAINAYHHLRTHPASDGRTSSLVIGERAQRANPASAIEQDGMDERGMRYRVNPDMSNAQAAALATCHWAAHYGGMADKAVEASDDLLSALMGGRGFSVGGDYFNGKRVEPGEILAGYRVDADVVRMYGKIMGISS